MQFAITCGETKIYPISFAFPSCSRDVLFLFLFFIQRPLFPSLKNIILQVPNVDAAALNVCGIRPAGHGRNWYPYPFYPFLDNVNRYSPSTHA